MEPCQRPLLLAYVNSNSCTSFKLGDPSCTKGGPRPSRESLSSGPTLPKRVWCLEPLIPPTIHRCIKANQKPKDENHASRIPAPPHDNSQGSDKTFENGKQKRFENPLLIKPKKATQLLRECQGAFGIVRVWVFSENMPQRLQRQHDWWPQIFK